jgi:hypothetical protein
LNGAVTGGDLTGLTLDSGDHIVLADGASYTLTPVQAAIAQVGADGTPGILTSSGVTTIKVTSVGLVGAGLAGASGSLYKPTEIRGFTVGDKIDLSSLLNWNNPDLCNINDSAQNNLPPNDRVGGVSLVRGTYSPLGSYAPGLGYFVQGGGPDELFIYDANSYAPGGLESIILIGSTIPRFSSNGNAVFTFY